MTKSNLTIYSEPFGSTGNIGDNFLRLLGAPTLDRLQTLIREAVQNVADASIQGSGPEIEIRLRHLTAEQHRTLASRIFRELPHGSPSKDCLQDMRSRERLLVMEICDFGTIGLGGPTRADRMPAETEVTDFIDFLRNVGTARDTQQGAGTYGFGKVALYTASRCDTIIVDTLPRGSGPEGRRLIACHAGNSYSKNEGNVMRRFTGRHWWGVADTDDGIVDPVTGDVASQIAAELGLPTRDGGRTGTSIMILDFDSGGEGIDVLGARVVESLLWHFWPRMMRDAPTEKRFNCRVEVEGSAISIPFPDDIAPLHLFSKAMQAARRGTGNDVRPISSRRPKQRLGTLAIERGLRVPRRKLVEPDSLFPDPVNHIALMRPVELVVKYIEGQPLPDERVEWAGVFVASDKEQVERAFADSEPPAHDNWVPDYLPKSSWAKRYVNVALRKLKSAALEMGLPSQAQAGDPHANAPLARLAGRLGSILEGVEGDGAGRRRRTPGGGRNPRPRRATATQPNFERLETSRDGPVAVFSTRVVQDSGRTGAVLSARGEVAVEGTTLRDPDGAIVQPIVLSIRSVESGRSERGGEVELSGDDGIFEIRVRVPENCAVRATAKVLPGT